MSDALIGYTGFVGHNLDQQHTFAARFNSANIGAVSERAYETVVCAAAPGSMLTANRQPEIDYARIAELMERLDQIDTQRFVLISSIAVLANCSGGNDERTDSFQEGLAYGRHRRLLEEFCTDRFEDCLVVRLPALFGPGLRKNFIFDLMNPVPSMLPRDQLDTQLELLEPSLRDALAGFYTADRVAGMHHLDRAALDSDPLRSELDAAVIAIGMHATQFHNRDTTFQYYNLSKLWQDIEISKKAELRCIHLATEPLRAADIHERLLGVEMPETGAPVHREDMHTHHAGLWGRARPYLQDSAAVLKDLSVFFAEHRCAS